MSEDLKSGDVDPENTSKSYWNRVLQRCGLSMASGLAVPTWLRGVPGRLPISYLGTSNNLTGMEEEQNRKDRTGR